MSLLKRTDTRAGSDPPSSLRAASIAGTSPVTSRCHLHGSKATITGATETLDGAQEARHAPRAQASLRLSHLALDSASSGEGRWTGSGLGAEAAGRCSPASRRCLPSATWLASPCSLAQPLARSASSHSLPVPQPFKPQVNKLRMLPSAGFWCLSFSTGSAFSVHLLYA